MLPFNAHSLPDLLAVMVVAPLAVNFIIRYWFMGRQPLELLLGVVLFELATICALMFLEDNVVRTGQRAADVAGGAVRTLALYRVMYAFICLMPATTLHFIVIYARSFGRLARQVRWLYAVTICLLPFVWSPLFFAPATHPTDVPASWKNTVPFQPEAGVLLVTFTLVCLSVFAVELQLLRSYVPPKPAGGTHPLMSLQLMRAGTALLLIAGVVDMLIVVAFDWAGIAAFPFGVSVAAVLYTIALVRDRLKVEQERTRVTARFRSYVDPALVDYVLAHPDKDHFDGERREVTVVFNDIAGFTGLSERLQERAVRLLSEYRRCVIPVIRAHNGYVNKFLGDGIMFFFGAPRANPDHAGEAIATVLESFDVVDDFNRRVGAELGAHLHIRAGINTGPVIVGDAGPSDASDYTVLGDVVNVAARLESANKFFGTRTLISDQTLRAAGNRFLTREIARVRLYGKSTCTTVHEVLCPAAAAGNDLQRLAMLSTAAVRAYISGDFSACLDRADYLDAEFGRSQFTNVYRDACRHAAVNSSGTAPFTGEIVMDLK